MEHAVRELEKVVKAMRRKLIHLENEITNINVNNKNAKVDEPFKDTSEYINSTPVSTEKSLAVVDEKSVKSKKDYFKCEQCDYRCKKEGTLKKHISLKHLA
jgi:hypothetical protein